MSGKRTAQTIRPGRAKGTRFVPETFEVAQINVLPQMRVRFDEETIMALAGSLLSMGFLAEPITAILSRDEARILLSFTNRMAGTKIKFRSLRSITYKGKKVYVILVAGERRYRAMQLNVRNGDAVDQMPVKVCWHLTPLELKQIQLLENSYEPPQPEEQARAYAEYYYAVKEVDPHITLIEVAKRLGRTEEVIRKAIRFCNLPIAIQDVIQDHNGKKNKVIPFAVALQLERLQREIEATERELLEWIRDYLLHRMNVARFTELVTNYIEAKEVGQSDLLTVFGAEAAHLEWLHSRRRVFERQLAMLLVAGEHYFKALGNADEKGLFDPEGWALHSTRSPRRRIERHLAAIGNALAFAERHFSSSYNKKIAKRMRALKKALKDD